MERNRLLTIAVIGLLLMNAATLAFLLLRKPPHPEGRKEELFKIIIDKLQLNEAQQKQYMLTVKEHHQTFESLNEKARNIRFEYFKLLQNEVADSLAADSLRLLLSKNQYDMDALNFHHLQEIKGLCNEKQKILFNNFVSEIGRYFSQPPRRREE